MDRVKVKTCLFGVCQQPQLFSLSKRVSAIPDDNLSIKWKNSSLSFNEALKKKFQTCEKWKLGYRKATSYRIYKENVFFFFMQNRV